MSILESIGWVGGAAGFAAVLGIILKRTWFKPLKEVNYMPPIVHDIEPYATETRFYCVVEMGNTAGPGARMCAAHLVDKRLKKQLGDGWIYRDIALRTVRLYDNTFRVDIHPCGDDTFLAIANSNKQEKTT